MTGLVGALAGLIVGALAMWAWTQRRAQLLRDASSNSATQLAIRDAQLTQMGATLEHERSEHAQALLNMEVVFENLSNRVLSNTVEQFNQSQEQVSKVRDSKLDLTLKPLEALLEEYKKNLAEFNEKHSGALFTVQRSASDLLEAQLQTQVETRRLNQLLGRSDQRGHWGEVQLANVLEASGLRRDIDYDLQVTSTTDTGRVRRPDCVVRMPNGTSIAVDAKFPFDKFEAALATEESEQREMLFGEHAKALRGHVKTLKEKSYWEVIAPAPEFVVCFVPSDYAISMALHADRELQAYATKERVLICGPTTLLSLLWSVAMVMQQHQAALNVEEILQHAEQIFDRIRLVAEPIVKMGKSLDDSVSSYNKMVGSFESRLIPAARKLRGLGGALRARPLPELGESHEATVPLNADRWGMGPGSALPVGVSEIIDADDDEDFNEE